MPTSIANRSARTPAELAEDLQLLRLFSEENYYSDLPARASYEDRRDAAFTRIDHRNLLVISYCLAGSGLPRDAVSVGLDQSRRDVEVVLALDRPVTDTDRFNAHRLFASLSQAVKNTDGTSFTAVQQVVGDISRPALVRRIRKVLLRLQEFDLPSALDAYPDAGVSEAEFGAGYQTCMMHFGDIGVAGAIRALVEGVKSSAGEWFESAGTGADVLVLQRTIAYCEAIALTRFMRETSQGQPSTHPSARLMRALAKIKLYGTAIGHVVQSWGRLVSCGQPEPRFRWLDTPSRPASSFPLRLGAHCVCALSSRIPASTSASRRCRLHIRLSRPTGSPRSPPSLTPRSGSLSSLTRSLTQKATRYTSVGRSGRAMRVPSGWRRTTGPEAPIGGSGGVTATSTRHGCPLTISEHSALLTQR